MITLYGVTEDGTTVPVQVTEDGKLVVHKDGSFEPGDDLEAGNITADSIAAGNITAAGNIVSGLDPQGNQINVGTSLRSTGRLDVKGNALNAVIFAGSVFGSDDLTASITADGKITAAGGLFNLAANCNLKLGETNGENNASLFITPGTNPAPSAYTVFGIYKPDDSDFVFSVLGDGKITAAGNVNIGSFDTTSDSGEGTLLQSIGTGLFQRPSTSNERTIGVYKGKKETFSVAADGRISAVSNKCGFTSEGELIFTSRGERYRLIIQGNMLYPDPYPISLELKEKLDRREPKTDTTDIVRPDQ